MSIPPRIRVPETVSLAKNAKWSEQETDIFTRAMPKLALARRYRGTNARIFQRNLDLGLPKQLVTLAMGFDGQIFVLGTCVTT